MKKVFAILMALCMMLSAAAALADTLTMGTNAAFPPYEYYENDQIVGIDAEIAAAIAEKLGMELVIEDMEFNSIISAVQTGKIDFGMAGMTVTPERQQSVNFSDTYAEGVQAIIVKEGSDIKTADDLFAEGATWKIGVQEATTGDIYCTGDFGDERVFKYKVGADAVEALKTGKVDCVIIDNNPAKAYVDMNEGLVILETEYTQEEYAIAVALENTELLEKINAALKELWEEGKIQEILEKYIPSENG
jgi:polar amino acid transport system substrate-binding protein